MIYDILSSIYKFLIKKKRKNSILIYCLNVLSDIIFEATKYYPLGGGLKVL